MGAAREKGILYDNCWSGKGGGLRKLASNALAVFVSLTLVVAFAPSFAGVAYAATGDSSDDPVTSVGTYTVSVTESGEYGYLYFTPLETALYTATASASESALYMSIQSYSYDDDDEDYYWTNMASAYSSSEGASASAESLLAAGGSYRVRVAFYDTDEDEFASTTGDITVTLEQTAISVMPLTSVGSYDATIETAGEYLIYSFTAPASATYRFYTTGSYDTYSYLYDSSWTLLDEDDDGGEGVNTAVSCGLEAGETCYFVVRMLDSSETGSFTVAVAQSASIEGATVTLSAYSYEFTGNSITPEVTVTLDGSVLEEDVDYYTSYSSNRFPGTATVYVYGYDGTELTASFTITEPDAATLSLGTERSAAIADGDYVIYSFTPTATARYSFTMTSTASSSYYLLYLYDLDESDWDDNDGEGADSISLTWYCSAGCTYYVKMLAYDDDGATNTYTLTASEYEGSDDDDSSSGLSLASAAASATAVCAGKTYSTTINTEGGYAYYRITPSSSATYTFYTTGDYDTYSYLYDSSWSLLASDDDDDSGVGATSGFNTCISYDLTAGTTYYLVYQFLSSSVTGTFDVVVAGPTDLSVAKVTASSCTYAGKALTPSVTVKLDGATLVAGTDYTVAYSNNKNAGTGTVTVTGAGSYSGTASATFTIAKASQSLKVTKKTKTVKYKKLKKKKLTVKAITKVSGAKGTLSYTKGAVKYKGKKASKKVAKKIVVNKKKGKITLKKGLKKGTYTVKVKVKAAATGNYKAASKTVTVKIKVK